jgi:putative ABC transport system permease protein
VIARGVALIIPFETLRNELGQAFRQIRKAPGFFGAVILVLAAGFGISSAIFGAVRSVLLAPLPYNRPERLLI